MQKTELKTRPPKATDLNFIFASFSNSMKRESELGRSCRSSIFFPDFQKVIDRILATSQVLIACSPEEENAIMGYLIYERPETVHFAFVRPSCRMKNVARDMIEEVMPGSKNIIFSLITNDAKKISKKYPEFTHNPLILFNKGE